MLHTTNLFCILIIDILRPLWLNLHSPHSISIKLATECTRKRKPLFLSLFFSRFLSISTAVAISHSFRAAHHNTRNAFITTSNHETNMQRAFHTTQSIDFVIFQFRDLECLLEQVQPCWIQSRSSFQTYIAISPHSFIHPSIRSFIRSFD